MADERTAERSEPADVQITVIPRGGRAHMRVVTGACLALALLIGVGATLAATLPDAHNRRSVTEDPMARLDGPSGVAAAYGFPLRCLSVTIAPDRTFARADFDHGSPCGRYDGYVTAIFHRVDGAWRTVLVANGYSCPVASIPLEVQAKLDVCA